MKILLADDDPQILRALRITLAAYGYEVIPAADGAAAVRLAVERHPDLLLLDLGMPKLDGIEVISAVRGWSSMPILVLSGRSDATDKVAALDAGADDYVTKPFSTEELLARIRALSRRTPSAAGTTSTAGPAVIRFGQVSVDMAAKVVTRGPDQRVLRLTPTEWQVLEVLLNAPGKLVTQQFLLEQVWGPHLLKETGYLRLYVGQLRKKLEPVPSTPRYLITEPGMGYRFVPDEGS
ncbi:DNA-binding response regulator [Arthrobacter sp. MYb227]|uniref:response regulator n=1 Tax=Arthrobacter sp. MYb227 TaxID=1848601 RepID=UPI000CFC7A53|nr:response regulator transcription factor [Arthrobacter sp. MYb227]PQZ95060.1 DNA-binding response regulator [Arthrobacter sp. MYb227]